MDSETIPQTKLVGALVGGISVLRYLSASSSPLGVTQVARDLNINPSTCFNLLRTLVHEGLVVFNPDTKTYQIGLGLVEIAHSALNGASLVRLVQPLLDKISVENQVTLTLWQKMQDDRVMLIANSGPGSVISINMNIGQRLPCFVGALGRCYAAFSGLSKQQLKSAYSKIRIENPAPFEEWYDSLADVRESKCAIDEGNFSQGFTTVSAPIFDAEDHPAMTISAVAVTAQLDNKKLEKIAEAVKQTALTVTAAIQGMPQKS
ncbi:MAG: IclR family transcriptional regulator [Sneathiella sp.]|uniref:IclR family transcriptional regulator n=1 Tax=Sneathiella sp. TaxID=1964365 RepID=UPI000C58394E|nr:IclR family transcriptional regulator [Sneathiella sp.]MAZ04422.1 IclR family transcriptional regulator [Sneathiella sp.]